MTLREYYKSKGYSDADLAVLEPILSDQRLAGAVEEVFTERDTLKSLNDQWADKLEKEYNPAITAAEKEAADSRISLARANEALKIARERGFVVDDDTRPAAVVPPVDTFDPKKHNLVTMDDVARFANAEGDAIAMAHDLSAEYERLYAGASLLDYQGADGKRGMRALRAEAVAARKPMDLYVAEKFKFAEKRAEVEAAKTKAHEDQIRADERSKVAAEFGNPALRAASPSRQPYIPTDKGKSDLPWQRGSDDQLRAARLERANTNLAKEAIQ